MQLARAQGEQDAPRLFRADLFSHNCLQKLAGFCKWPSLDIARPHMKRPPTGPITNGWKRTRRLVRLGSRTKMLLYCTVCSIDSFLLLVLTQTAGHAVQVSRFRVLTDGWHLYTRCAEVSLTCIIFTHSFTQKRAHVQCGWCGALNGESTRAISGWEQRRPQRRLRWQLASSTPSSSFAPP